jgi:type II secretory pathway component PulM
VSVVERLRSWFDALQPRERRSLAIGGVAAVVILVGGGLLTLAGHVDEARSRVTQKSDDLAFVQQASAEILAAGPLEAFAAATEPLAVLADRAAREAGLGGQLAGSETTTDGALRLSFRDAGFDPLAAMLQRLSRQSGVRVEAATIDAAAETGRVNALIVLRADTRG